MHVVPQMFNLRPHLLKTIVHVNTDKVYHKQEVHILLYILGLIVT